jgi:hypothetical protein
MKKLNFVSDPDASNPRKRGAPLPYFIPAAAAAAAAAAASGNRRGGDNNDHTYFLQQKKFVNDELMTQLFNPYYYIADDTWDIAPHECARVYFDGMSDYHCFHSNPGYRQTLKKPKQVFFLLQNNSDTDILRIPLGTRLLSILITPHIQSDVIPAYRCYSISE